MRDDEPCSLTECRVHRHEMHMNLLLTSLVLSAILVAIPESSMVPAKDLGELVLEGRNSRPIASQTIQHPELMRPDTVLFLEEEPSREGGSCLRTRWSMSLKPTRRTEGSETWWVDRSKINSDQQIALSEPSGECPREGYVRMLNRSIGDPNRMDWALASFRAFLRDEKAFEFRCRAELIFKAACKDVKALRERLSAKTPLLIIQNGDQVLIRIDSSTDAEFNFATPAQITISLHYPASF